MPTVAAPGASTELVIPNVTPPFSRTDYTRDTMRRVDQARIFKLAERRIACGLGHAQRASGKYLAVTEANGFRRSDIHQL